MDHLSYMQLCRLCLVKDKVNVPIFDDANDVRQIFLKITACLPVKVSRDDNLPKKICNECLYKIDSLYQFWNTTINAEKQLLQWLNEIGVDTTVTNAAAPLQQILPQSHAHPHTEEIILKEEALEDLKPEHNNIIFPSYIPNQQQPPPPNLTKFQPADEEEEDDPPRRRTRGRPAKKKAASVLEAALTAQDSDSVDSDRLADGGADDSDYVDEERVTKEEVDSDEDYVDPLEPTQFVNVSNDAEQPGPSGLNNTAKSTTTLQPPTHTDTGCISIPDEDKFELREYIHDEDGKLICPVCLKKFPNRAKYSKHARYHAPAKLSCKICNRKYRFPYELRMHEGAHEAKYVCTICQRIFISAATLYHHEQRHKKNYKKLCNDCGKGFYSTYELNNHRKSDHSGFEFKCKECDKVFPNHGYWMNHCKVHGLGNEPQATTERTKPVYKRAKVICEVCGKIVSDIITHRRIHTGERPYVCDLCGLRFVKSSQLNFHARSHSAVKLYQCEICDKKFKNRGTLVIHVRTHTGELPYECNICGEKFISSSGRNCHVRKHGIKTSDSKFLKPFVEKLRRKNKQKATLNTNVLLISN